MSDQWGQPQPQDGGYGQSGGYPGQPPMQPPQPMQPGGPQGPYTQGPYGQQSGADSYGQAPMQPPQGPYGQVPQQGPYGPPQPQGPYGHPSDPFGQQPITPQNPYGQPQGPYGQPGQFPGQFPGQQPYGLPGLPGQPGQPGRPGGNRKNLFVGGAVLVVIIAAAAIFLATKGSGGGGGTKTQAESCASWKSEETTIDDQNPDTTSGAIGALNTDVPVIQGIANDAQSGTLKTQMTQTAGEFSSFRSYLQANPSTDLTSDSPPAQLEGIEEALQTDLDAVDSTCGISDDSSGSGTGL